MNWLNKAKILVGVLSGIGLFASCSSDTEELLNESGTGFVSFSIQANAGFQTTRAADESAYEDLADYTVQILKDGVVVNNCEWAGNTLPSELVELDNGSYTLKAFAGEEYENVNASTEGFYVAGESTFNVNSNQVSASVSCIPQCARVKVAFDELMPDYFNNYYVEFSGTTALGSAKSTWEKDDTDPIYLSLTKDETVTATIKLVDKEGKVAEDIIRTKTLAPGKAWALNIAPAIENGQVGISITIDGTTNDHEVDIEIPADWL